MEINQVSGLFFPPEEPHLRGILEDRTLNKVCSPVRVVFLPFALPPSFQDPELHQPVATEAQAALTFTFPTSSSLFVSMRSSRICPPCWLSITCVRKLSSIHSLNVLDGLCPALLPSYEILGWLKFPVRISTCTREASPTVYDGGNSWTVFPLLDSLNMVSTHFVAYIKQVIFPTVLSVATLESTKTLLIQNSKAIVPGNCLKEHSRKSCLSVVL